MTPEQIAERLDVLRDQLEQRSRTAKDPYTLEWAIEELDQLLAEIEETS